jgi:hypothetical protein
MAFSFNTPEEMIEFLKNSDEGKKVFDSATEGFIKPDQIQGLVKNRDDALKEKKDLKTKYDENVKKLEEFEEKFNKIEADYDIKLREELEKKANAQSENADNSDTIKQLNDFKALHSSKEKQWDREKNKLLSSIEEKEKNLEGLISKYNNTLITNSLNANFDEIGVAEEHRRLLKDAYRSRATIEVDEEGERSVMIIAEEGRLPIQEYFTSWAESKEAKYYIKAPINNGGGTTGGTGAYRGRDLVAEFNAAMLKQRLIAEQQK